MRILGVFGLAAAAVVLAACAAPLIADGASVVATDKTLIDHAVSIYKGKNCSAVRKEQGLTYCAEDERVPPAPNIHCYRTIADPVCYAQPDPSAHQDEIGQNNRPVR